MGINLGSSPISNLKVGSDQVDKVYLGTTEVWNASPTPTIRALKFSSPVSQEIKVSSTNLGDISPNFEYSTDGGSTWITWTDVTQPIAFGSGTELYLRGSNTVLAYGLYRTQFSFKPFNADSGNYVDCVGNLMHLFDYTQDLTAFPNPSTSTGARMMFNVCGALRTAPDLPATILVDSNCYYRTFYNCSQLLACPKLPATTLKEDCYQEMFRGCTNLQSIAALPATTLATDCYNGMFRGCTKIKMATAQDSEYPNEYVFGADPSGYASSMFTSTGGTFIGAPTQTTYYTSNTIIT